MVIKTIIYDNHNHKISTVIHSNSYEEDFELYALELQELEELMKLDIDTYKKSLVNDDDLGFVLRRETK